MANVPYRKIPVGSQPTGQQITDSINKALAAGYDSSGGNSISLQKNTNIQTKTVDITVPDPWIPIVLSGAWLNSGGTLRPLSVMKSYDGMVTVSGSVKSGAATSTICTTVPQSYRPPFDMRITCSQAGALGVIIPASNGSIVYAAGPSPSAQLAIHYSYMPANNRCEPLSCFPIDVKTRFQRPPHAVLAVGNSRLADDGNLLPNVALMPNWEFRRAASGPVVRIRNIPGLEYGVRQKVDIIIIGGE